MAASMGMGREMIDWTKPIETTEDGTPARVLGLLSLSMASSPLTPDADGFEPMMVWVEGARNGGWGNIFLINNQGFRCDDRALFSARQEPFIRNVRVKREGWVLVKSYSDGAPHFGPVRFLRMMATQHIYATEEEAMSAKAYYGNAAGAKAVLFQWEE